MSKRFTKRNDPFTCEHCGRDVPAGTKGVLRNHCPYCLCSKHLDNMPGDRQATCGGIMQVVHVFYESQRVVLVHRCKRCGLERNNMAALAPCDPADDFEKICQLMEAAGKRM